MNLNHIFYRVHYAQSINLSYNNIKTFYDLFLLFLCVKFYQFTAYANGKKIKTFLGPHELRTITNPGKNKGNMKQI